MKTNALVFLALALSALTALGDQKVSNRVSLAAGSVAPATDILPIVDVSAGSAGSKKITVDNLFTGWGFTADGKTIATAADFAAMRTSLGLVVGTNVQAWDADLDTWATKTAPSGTAVGTSDTQALTNKTLTSPVINVGSDATGDMYYRDSGGVFTRLGVGSDGNILKLASGLPSWTAASDALDNWASAVSTSSPNATVPVVSITATNAATNVDAALRPKGTGAVTAHVADSSTTGGNKRGQSAVDWQTVRTAASQVSSGGWAAIGGGTGNTASGSQSVVAGGASNLASSQWSSVLGGSSNSASGNYGAIAGGSSNSLSVSYSTIGGGESNSITGLTHSTIGGGYTNSATGGYCAIGGGYSNTASGSQSWIPGGRQATTRGLSGMGAWANGVFSTSGDAQRGEYLLRRTTTDATTTELSTDGGTPGSANRIILPNNHAYAVRGRVVARDTSSGDVAVFELKGGIKRGANAAATAIVGSPTVTLLFNDAGAATWTVTLSADTANGSLKIEVTGEAGETIHWLAEIETLEVG